MIIRSKGYELKFIQKEASSDESAHQFTLVYKFYSSVTKLYYILRAECHKDDVFAVKFYVKKYRKSEYKYCKITNKGDISNILVTNAKIIPIVLKEFPTASFAFSGARTLDTESMKVEGYELNQRFRVYRHFVSLLIGNKTFEHYEYPHISGYLLVNKSVSDIVVTEANIVRMFSETYQDLPDLI